MWLWSLPVNLKILRALTGKPSGQELFRGFRFHFRSIHSYVFFDDGEESNANLNS